MASRSNPNVPSKQRRLASRRKVQKKKAINKVTKNPRGTARSSVLYPTGGPLAPISKKKARKLERAQNHARARAIENAMEQEEAEMIDAPDTTKKAGAKDNGGDESMDVDIS